MQQLKTERVESNPDGIIEKQRALFTQCQLTAEIQCIFFFYFIIISYYFLLFVFISLFNSLCGIIMFILSVERY